MYQKGLSSFKGKLALIKYGSGVQPYSTLCSIYVMTEYGVLDSWNKLYVLPIENPSDFIGTFCQKLKEYGQTPNVSMFLYLPQIVTSRSYEVMVLDHYTTPLSPLSHSILMEWCVYKHQEWYPLRCGTYSAYLLVFTECCEALRLWVMFASLQQCVTPSRNVFGPWVIQTRIQNVFEQLVYVEASSRQRKIILKLLCDHWFRPREVCRKTDYLYSVASFYF